MLERHTHVGAKLSLDQMVKKGGLGVTRGAPVVVQKVVEDQGVYNIKLTNKALVVYLITGVVIRVSSL